jgi:hypothetical protein
LITNTADISLPLAIWLLHDEYDHIKTANYISATSLMKPLRQILLAPRVDKSSQVTDIQDLIPRVLGNSIHDSIEKALTQGYRRSLSLLGYSETVIDRIRINPTDQELRGSNSIMPIFIEQRAFREFEGFTIGGKFDLVTDGMVQDNKTTSSYTWMNNNKDSDYQLQMSLYRWIDAAQDLPKITEDYGRINFIFTDWQRNQARINPKYPQKRVESKDIPLLSLHETENWVRAKLSLIQRYKDAPEEEIPDCSDEELWRSEPVHKYYSDATKLTGRATRNFDSLAEANAYRAEKGKGLVLTVSGEPKRCHYCEAFSVCSQKDRYFTT